MSDRTFLEEITIRSIGVIEQSTLEISPGLTVLTGETGAGKTMILTALNLILGGKSDSSLVRTGSERLIASGRFSVPSELASSFEDAGLQVEDGELILTRTVNADGKSKATSNSIAVPASALISASENLVEVHAQAANLNMTKAAKQRELLDRFAGAKLRTSLDIYQEHLHRYHDLKARIAAMKKSIDSRDAQLQELREFVQTMTKLKVMRNEVADIAMAFTVMMHISFVDSMHFAPGYRAIWASSVLVSSCAFIVNEIVFYYQLKNDGKREWVYIRSTYTHMFFLHALPPLTCWYCAHNSESRCII